MYRSAAARFHPRAYHAARVGAAMGASLPWAPATAATTPEVASCCRFQSSRGAPLKAAGAGGGAAEAIDPSKISHAAVWGLWNEGNLFSLTLPELSAFLQTVNVPLPEGSKKSKAVRLVEEFMSKASPPTINKDASLKEDLNASLSSNAPTAADGGGAGNAMGKAEELEQLKYSSRGTDVFEEADVYGDWGVEQNFEQRQEHEFMSFSHEGLYQDSSLTPMSSRSFQLLHDGATADVVLQAIDARLLPGCGGAVGAEGDAAAATTGQFHALHVRSIPPQDANKQRFKKAFKWCCVNMWHSNIDGEINIGAGKALYWRRTAKFNRNVLPIWACQHQLHAQHPYTWFAVAHESNTAAMEQFATQSLKMKLLTETPVVTFKGQIKRARDFLDAEFDAQLRTTVIRKPWDRFCTTHLLREQMPDLRFLVRARNMLKPKVAEPYYNSTALKKTDTALVSTLPPELGDIVYVCERHIRQWSTTLPSGLVLKLVETKRTPLIVRSKGEESERLEYELIANMPQQGENLDIYGVAEDLWGKGQEMAAVLEEGMKELQGFSMPASAAFDDVARPVSH